jgi:amidase
VAIQNPSADQIRRIAEGLGLRVDAEDVESYRALVEANLGALAAVDAMADETPPPAYPRDGGERPPAAENPLGAWYVRTHLEGAAEGKLAGRTVALKDNVLLAGVPLMNGTSILEGYVPPVDATIVTRMLDAGAHIVGKAVCEAYCFSGGSHTSATGPVRNPHDPRRSAGGSSSGSAALVAAGEVDLAIGCDQGGSIRMPSSFCGIYGMKPTHGLVPYTGILGIDPTLDHAGPMTSSVHDNALLLEVIAGADGLDSRQVAPRTAAYTEALAAGLGGVRIGVVREGFGHDTSEPEVDAKVRDAAQRFQKLGARVRELSLPEHLEGGPIFLSRIPAAIELLFHADGLPLGRQDPAVVSYLQAQRAWRRRVDELPENLKLFLILSGYVKEQCGFEYVAKAENQVRRLRAAYDRALGEVDLLLMPTTPMKAPILPSPGASREAILEAAFAPLANTMPFDLTHHPAMSIPCGTSAGMPVGLMLVGRHFEESTIYTAAHAFEQHEDWRSF